MNISLFSPFLLQEQVLIVRTVQYMHYKFIEHSVDYNSSFFHDRLFSIQFVCTKMILKMEKGSVLRSNIISSRLSDIAVKKS